MSRPHSSQKQISTALIKTRMETAKFCMGAPEFPTSILVRRGLHQSFNRESDAAVRAGLLAQSTRIKNAYDKGWRPSHGRIMENRSDIGLKNLDEFELNSQEMAKTHTESTAWLIQFSSRKSIAWLSGCEWPNRPAFHPSRTPPPTQKGNRKGEKFANSLRNTRK